MSTAKDEVRRLLDELTDYASLEDIRYHVYAREKIGLGRKAVRGGRVVDQPEPDREMPSYPPGV